jgi:hypothetical protein
MKRPIVESCLAIDVRRWARDGLLRPYRAFGWTWCCGDEPLTSIGVAVEPDAQLLVRAGVVVLTFQWRHPGTAEWERACQREPVVWTKCHLGGAVSGTGRASLRLRHFGSSSATPK